MNKKIVALAVAAAFAIPAAASAQVTLFGQFKYEVGAIQANVFEEVETGVIGEDGVPVTERQIVDDERNAVHSTLGTRIGIRGSEDLGGGLTAIFRFQGSPGGVNQSLGSSSWDFNEENWVGLQGAFGTIQLGRSDTAFKKGQTRFRVFPDSLADQTTRPASFGRAEGVHYSSPSFNGVTVNATVEPNGNEFDSYWALGVNYVAGPLFVGAAVESAEDTGLYQGGGKDIVPDNTNWQIGANYTWNDLTVGVLYQDIDDISEWVTLPVTYQLGNVQLRAALQYRDNDTSEFTEELGVSGEDGWNYALGVGYNFSSRTEAFAHLWYDGEAGVRSTPGAGGLLEETQFGLGLRHSF